jgi:FlaA1/EpsC-like NDP-sugar epimerase
MRPAAKRLICIPALAGALALASALAAGWVSGAQTGRAAGVLVLARVLASLVFRLDRLDWRELTFRDAVTASLACAGGSAIAAAACVMLPGPWPSRMLAADLAIYACLLLGGAALAGIGRLRTSSRGARRVRTLIWGAGSEGRATLERIRRRNPEIEVVGWLDDDPSLAELDLDGTPVLGPVESLPLLVELHRVQAVIVAIPRLSSERRALAEDLARWSGARLVFIPDASECLATLAPHPVAAGLSPVETRR